MMVDNRRLECKKELHKKILNSMNVYGEFEEGQMAWEEWSQILIGS